VDNRIEAPARAPGDGPSGVSAADGPDEAESSATQQSPAGEAEQQADAATDGGQVWSAAAGWQSESAGEDATTGGANAGSSQLADKARVTGGKPKERKSALTLPAGGSTLPAAKPAASAEAAPGTPSAGTVPDQPQPNGGAEAAPRSTYDVFRSAPASPPEDPATPAQTGPAYSLLPPDPPPPVGPAAVASSLPSVAAVADGVRDVASRVSSSFSGSFARLSERTSQFRSGVGQRSAPSGSAPTAPQPQVPGPQVPGPQAPSPQVSRPQASRPQVRPAPRASRGQPRRALLTLERLEPWSVMKFSFLVLLVCWVIFFIVVAVLYFTLSKLGVFHSIETNWNLVTTNKNSTGSRISEWFSASRILGYTMIIGALGVVLMTALAGIGAALYNLIAALTGGVEVTLKESD
jgi:hypothetical protein